MKLIFLLGLLLIKFNLSISFNLKSNGTLLECSKDPYLDHLNRVPLSFHTIENCHRKIRLTLNIENEDKTPEGLRYILVKDVVDNATKNKVRLLNPILFRLRQEQVILSYPFKYLSAVNGKAAEVVINYENRKNYSGCDDTSQINPTCGLKHEKGVVVPFSEGFCCFCPEAPIPEKQTRGGQSCDLVVEPDDFEKQKYKASAHCLHMSDIWYSVSALKQPFVLHETFLQVYTQKDIINGSSVWLALTHDKDFELGIRNPYQYDENKTIVVSYSTSMPKNGTAMIPYLDTRLLIPQPMPSLEPDKIPHAIKNGATDYLLLPEKLISSYGSDCDRAGVSYEAFAKQPDRCKVPKNTCLKNQPLDFWEADDERRKLKERGTHLLEFFGTPYKDPIIIDSESEEHWLALEYYSKHLTTLTIELNADNIIPLHAGKEVQIASVVTSNINEKIDFYVRILNSGLLAAKFSVQAVRCSFGVPDSNDASAIVPPQLKHDFLVTTNVGNSELDEKITCVVEVGNAANGIVAKREVSVKPYKRCICNNHCQCRCIGERLTCKPMDEKDYNLAGFKGSLPILTAKPPYKSYFQRHPKLVVLWIVLFLLLCGLIKATFGLMGFSSVSRAGLTTCIYQSRKIPHYYEPELKNMCVIYDANGYPVNPNTKEHARVFGEEILFLFNMFFCCLWPIILLRDCCFKKKDEFYNNYPSVSSPDYPIDPYEDVVYERPPESLENQYGDVIYEIPPKSSSENQYDTAALLTGSREFSEVTEAQESSEESDISEFDHFSADKSKSFEEQIYNTKSNMEEMSSKSKDNLAKRSLSEAALQEFKPRPKPLTDQQKRWQKGNRTVKAIIGK